MSSNHGAGVSVAHADYANSAGSVSGGLKTINGQSIIGSGDITVPAVKSVQRGQASWGSYATTTVTFSAVNRAKSLLLTNAAGATDSNGYFISSNVYFTSDSTIYIAIGGPNGGTLEWQVIEFY
jgi:hypothetical protein